MAKMEFENVKVTLSQEELKLIKGALKFSWDNNTGNSASDDAYISQLLEDLGD